VDFSPIRTTVALLDPSNTGLPGIVPPRDERRREFPPPRSHRIILDPPLDREPHRSTGGYAQPL